MSSVFSFDFMLIFGFLSILLLIGLILRSKIKFFQNFFVPACIIAGILGLIIRETAVYLGLITNSVLLFETSVYHLFNITFISLGLTYRRNKKNKSCLRNIVNMGLLISSVAALQFIIGGAIVFIFNLFGYRLFPTFGFLVAMGFEEGPGQALSIGKTWEGFGFANASSIGLSFATLGFIFAIFVGVPLVSWAIRTGRISAVDSSISNAFKTGLFSKDDDKIYAGFQTTHASTIDSLSLHAALIGFVYILTYGFIKILELFSPSDIAEMLWGFFFIWGLLIAFIIRIIIEKIGIGHHLDHELQSRITGWGVDYLVVAAITAISLKVFIDYAIPIFTIALVVGVLTLIWIYYFGNRIWKKYRFERTAGLYGMETGTVATGLMLIRIIDPEFKTPAATDLALSSFIALPLIFIMINIMNAPILFDWSLELTLAVFFVILIVILGFIKLFQIIGKGFKE
jgi:ESS family glutamate:Na+ symporter